MRTKLLLLVAIANIVLNRSLLADDGRLVGQVVDDQGSAVSKAWVVVFDQETGSPINRPNAEQEESLEWLSAVTDDQGEFSIPDVKQGKYKLIAQTWDQTKKSVRSLTETPDRTWQYVRLRGVIDQVQVPSDAATHLTLRPIGTARLKVRTDPESPNTETILAISRGRMSADPACGLASWVGDFGREIISGNRMPYGVTTIDGLPEGEVTVAIFALDNMPGFGGKIVKLERDKTHTVTVRFIASWSNGHKKPPTTLKPMVDRVRQMQSAEFEQLLNDQQPDLLNSLKPREAESLFAVMARPAQFWERKIKLPNGEDVLFKDFWAAKIYAALHK